MIGIELSGQGSDPSTDFRGGGYISLENLIFFSKMYPDSLQNLLHKRDGNRVEWEYPFAVAGIKLIECRRELECRDPLLRQSFFELDYEGNSFGDGSFNGFSNGVTFETDKEGHIRNIYFPFDIESDTALSVATEMVAELDITDQDVIKIVDMIDGEIVSLVPEWKSGSGIEETPCFANLRFCHNCASNHTSDGSFMNFLSKNPSAKDLQILQCSGNGCNAWTV
ncbi:hypothetical protein F0562_003974 [Nyssa sinensis]|uniref:ELMO domain-containing protein n=1 Tax=Nyssa sinensis TaxID=561372 RepID=A0A5J5BWX1_9ASTE|nr:hypothetical protein F0562_003974 [Nyssa sinensis]